MNESIPICTSCGHRHVPGMIKNTPYQFISVLSLHIHTGIKCLICGHVGKSQIYLKMRIKANEKRSCHFDIIEGWNDPRSKLILEVRNSISSEEFEIMKVFGEDLDRFSTHLLVTVGDSPAGVGRIRVEMDHAAVVVLENFIILPYYRRRGLLKQCFRRIISDIMAHNKNNYGADSSTHRPLTHLAFIVPAHSAWLSQFLLSVFGPTLRVLSLQHPSSVVYRLEVPIDGPSIEAIQRVLGKG